MSARTVKSFSPKKRAAAQPVEFELLDQKFVAVPKIPGITLLEFIASGDGSDGDGSVAKGILDYLKASMKKDEYKRFHDLVSDPDHEIDIELLSEIVSYLIEQQASRPTEAS